MMMKKAACIKSLKNDYTLLDTVHIIPPAFYSGHSTYPI